MIGGCAAQRRELMKSDLFSDVCSSSQQTNSLQQLQQQLQLVVRHLIVLNDSIFTAVSTHRHSFMSDVLVTPDLNTVQLYDLRLFITTITVRYDTRKVNMHRKSAYALPAKSTSIRSILSRTYWRQSRSRFSVYAALV